MMSYCKFYKDAVDFVSCVFDSKNFFVLRNVFVYAVRKLLHKISVFPDFFAFFENVSELAC